MDVRAPVSRRRFLALSTLWAAAASWLAGCARFQPHPALSPGDRRLVDALADQVIPPDDAPGGKEAGVGEFIDRQLRGPYRRHLETYRDGLAKIDLTSQSLEQRPFVDLPFARQTSLLESLEADRVPPGIWRRGEASDFFRLLTDHCLQGFYGSPRHGGNRNWASWRMLRLDYPQIAGRVIRPS